MDDTLTCPICNNKLRTIRIADRSLFFVNKRATFIERSCTTGMNHALQLFTDESSGQIDLIKVSLNHKYTRYIEIDFVNQKCRISCMKNGEQHLIDVPKMIFPDFPHLTKLKERVAMYVVFS
jgi:hypothetical protein